MNKLFIAPSLERANWLSLKEDVLELDKAGVDLFHIDIMDRTYGQTILLSPKVAIDLKEHTQTPLDLHFYVSNPEHYYPQIFKSCVGDYVNLEFEAVTDISNHLEIIRKNGCRPAVTLEIGTSLSVLEPILGQLDLINLLVRNTSHNSEPLSDYIIEKVKRCRELISNSGREILLEVDGSLSFDDTEILYKNGANVFVYGTKVIFRNGISFEQSVDEVRELARRIQP